MPVGWPHRMRSGSSIDSLGADESVGQSAKVRDWLEYERDHGYIRIRLRLTPTEQGGRGNRVWSDYRSSWDIGNTYNGEWTLNDAPLVLEDVEAIAPGEEAIARIHPLAPEYWGDIGPGTVIHAHEGSRRVATATVLEVVAPERDLR
jgi:hypothetical protein